MKKQSEATKPVRGRKQRFPPGWNQKRVDDVIACYDRQTEDEELAEYEEGMKIEGLTVMLVPSDLVHDVRQLIGCGRDA